MLVLATPEQEHALEVAVATGRGLQRMTIAEPYGHIPLLHRDHFSVAAYEANSQDSDVAALHIGYLKLLRARGARGPTPWRLAGLTPVGLTPKRRTAVVIAGSCAESDVTHWPLAIDVDERWYFKPEASGRLLVSPADTTSVPAADVQPDEIDAGVAVDRLEHAIDIQVGRIDHKWAGLRTFSSDSSLVIGRKPTMDQCCLLNAPRDREMRPRG